MRVLHLISSGGMYGAEAVILGLSHELQRQGHWSGIACFANASRQLQERAQAEGLPAMLVPCEGQLSLQAVRTLRTIVQEQRVDLVHAHGYKADLYAWAALRQRGIPLISTCHTWYDNDLAVRVYGALDRWVLRRYACVVAVSAEVERRLLQSGVEANRTRRIRNGIDLTRYARVAGARQAPTSALRVGLVGRLAREKGVDIFLNAAAIVAAATPEARFIVVGDGPDRELLEAQLRSLHLEDRVLLMGRQDNMPEVYAGLDLLVSASRQEGLPIALLEGMASGLAVVGTMAGEVPTLVRPGETGCLVPVEDAEALAQAILQLLRDDSRRQALGHGAHALVKREFSVERMTEAYLDAYRGALEEAHA